MLTPWRLAGNALAQPDYMSKTRGEVLADEAARQLLDVGRLLARFHTRRDAVPDAEGLTRAPVAKRLEADAGGPEPRRRPRAITATETGKPNRRKQWRDARLGLLTALLAGVAAGAQQLPSTPFRTGITVVPMTVTIERADGTYVGGLDVSRFRLLDDGLPREITLFDDGRLPIDLVVLLDVSGSMNARLPTMRAAAGELIGALRQHDRASLLTFGIRTAVLEPFTSDGARLIRALDGLAADGSTSLYDALYIALHEFDDRSAELRRRAVVVFSDGDDTTSLMAFDDVLEAARRRAVAIYTVRLVSPSHKADPFARDAVELREIARETGGRAFTSRGVDEVESAYASIARELAQQYVLGFVPADGQPPGFHRVTISVDEPRVTVRARTGYIVTAR